MIYADANASYPVDPLHYDQVAARLKDVDGNPSSIHARGRGAKVALEAARQSVARMLGVKPLEIIFTSGATEANNLAIFGLAQRVKRDESRLAEVVISAVEHSSVKEPAKLLEERGMARVAAAPVTRAGVVDTARLLAMIGPETDLVCIMHANNEMGAINDVAALSLAIKGKAKRAHVHVDAVQTLGKQDLTTYAATSIDSASFSAHKIGGLKGVGALYLRSGTKLAALISGGGQERGRRPGTENVPGIISFAMRCDEIKGNERKTADAMRRSQQMFLSRLQEIDGVVVHGEPHNGLPNTVNFHVQGVPGEDILLNLDLSGIAASSGSACSSGSGRPSPVLVAMGYDDWAALNSVRVSFPATGIGEQEVRAIAEVIAKTVSRVRR